MAKTKPNASVQFTYRPEQVRKGPLDKKPRKRDQYVDVSISSGDPQLSVLLSRLYLLKEEGIELDFSGFAPVIIDEKGRGMEEHAPLSLGITCFPKTAKQHKLMRELFSKDFKEMMRETKAVWRQQKRNWKLMNDRIDAEDKLKKRGAASTREG